MHLVSEPRLDLDERDGPRDECGVFGIYAPGARRRPARLLRAVRAPAPRAGVGRHRHLRERPHHDPARPGPGLPGLRRAEACALSRARWRSATCATRRPARSGWENAQPVYRSDRREVALAHNGNLINAVELHAELRERGRRVPLDLGLGDHRRAALHPRGGAARGRVADVMPRLRGRLLDGRHDPATRVVAFRDPAGLRPAVPGQARRPLLRRLARAARFDIIGAELLREVAARRDGLAGRARHRDAPGRREPRAAPSACSSTSTSRGRTRSWRATARRSRARKMGEILWPRGAGRGRPGDRGARLGQRRGAAAIRKASGIPAGRRPDQEPLRGAHVHPARPGAAQARPAA